MSPEEYRAALDRLGLSHTGAEHLLGVDSRTSRRYADGRPVPEPTARLLRLIEKGGGVHWARRKLGLKALVLVKRGRPPATSRV